MLDLGLKVAYRWDDINLIKSGQFPFPKSLTVFPSEVCNLSCPGCNSKKIHHKNGFMDFDLYKSIIDDFCLHGGQAVAFEGGGEPMLHPKIDLFIIYAVLRELRVGIITNGTVFKKEMLYADWVRVSVFNANKVDPRTKRNLKKLMARRKITKVGVKYLVSEVSPYPDEVLDSDYFQVKYLRNHPLSLVKNPDYVKPCGLTPVRAVVDFNGCFYPCPFFHAQENTTMGQGTLSKIWGSDNHKDAISKIKNCNQYDCPMLDIDFKKFEQADLDFI